MSELINATVNNDIKKVKELLKQGADIETKSDFTGGTALHIAARYGHKEVVALLEKHGAKNND